MRVIKRKIMDWYEDHEEGIHAIGMMAGGVALTYIIITPFMILWKKLGLYTQN